jgi:hypothetical protein
MGIAPMASRHAFIVPLALLILLLTGCAVTTYQPYSGGVGYSEVGLTKTRYEVLYHGTTGMDEATAKNHAITRAAEVGKRNGMNHFRIASANTRDDVTRSSVTDPNLFPRRPWTGEASRMTEWEWRREQELEASRRALNTYESRAPVVRLIIDYVTEDCATCLSVEAKLKEAEATGMLGKKK